MLRIPPEIPHKISERGTNGLKTRDADCRMISLLCTRCSPIYRKDSCFTSYINPSRQQNFRPETSPGNRSTVVYNHEFNSDLDRSLASPPQPLFILEDLAILYNCAADSHRDWLHSDNHQRLPSTFIPMGANSWCCMLTVDCGHCLRMDKFWYALKALQKKIPNLLVHPALIILFDLNLALTPRKTSNQRPNGADADDYGWEWEFGLRRWIRNHLIMWGWRRIQGWALLWRDLRECWGTIWVAFNLADIVGLGRLSDLRVSSNLGSGFWHKYMCWSRLTVANIARYVLCNFFEKPVDVGPKSVGSPPLIGSRTFFVSLWQPIHQGW
jgi:hypothetical protein